MSEKPTRRKNRLDGYDYSQEGAYFVTVCVKDRQELLGEIATVGANCVRPLLSDIGKITESEINKMSTIFDGVHVNCYVIMPNHVHMIILI
ncbi:MAG: hypothetical protein FWC13_01260 [Oscillospiraceae bacterium]|nr:hypothetical protein [Oscillospiraceae bacterium]